MMNQIRQTSELKDNLLQLTKIAEETSEPLFFREAGYADMVLLSRQAFEKLLFDNEVYFKLLEAERDEELSDTTYTKEEILNDIDNALME
ncbi:MAG: type II toxin-antitoxin system Phd/YefM family antitoxin [Clostridia bacterium]|nr:type II toxin-antitoxin system Phd/YefM family antitoxin [Clostridia bacterium]